MENKSTLNLFISIFTIFISCNSQEIEVKTPNVLFIAVDDLNDWVGYLGGHPQAQTPNIDRLIKKGVGFRKAYTVAPQCNPSRVALLTGLYPSTTGVYGNRDNFRKTLPNEITMLQHFRANGYVTKGGGKIFHGNTKIMVFQLFYHHFSKVVVMISHQTHHQSYCLQLHQ